MISEALTRREKICKFDRLLPIADNGKAQQLLVFLLVFLEMPA